MSMASKSRTGFEDSMTIDSKWIDSTSIDSCFVVRVASIFVVSKCRFILAFRTYRGARIQLWKCYEIYLITLSSTTARIYLCFYLILFALHSVTEYITFKCRGSNGASPRSDVVLQRSCHQGEAPHSHGCLRCNFGSRSEYSPL